MVSNRWPQHRWVKRRPTQSSVLIYNLGMALEHPALLLMGHVANALGIHEAIGGIYAGRQMNRIEDLLKELRVHVERLNPHILHANLQEVSNLETTSRRVERLSDVESLLYPLQRALGNDLLSTAIITTPEKLRAAFLRDPFEFLVNPRPLNRAQKPRDDGDYIPIIFSENGMHYLGWQTTGAIRDKWGTYYKPIEDKNLKDPRKEREIREWLREQQNKKTTIILKEEREIRERWLLREQPKQKIRRERQKIRRERQKIRREREKQTQREREIQTIDKRRSNATQLINVAFAVTVITFVGVYTFGIHYYIFIYYLILVWLITGAILGWLITDAIDAILDRWVRATKAENQKKETKTDSTRKRGKRVL